MKYKKYSEKSSVEPKPKYVKIEKRDTLTGSSHLTIKEDHVITDGSLTLKLEELKQLIEEYEELS